MSKPTEPTKEQTASEKRKARAKRYYDSHKEQIKLKAQEYKLNNKTACKSKNQDWYELSKESVKYRTIKRKYGLEPAEYDELIWGGCNVCGTREGKLCVDHNHATGEVRGCLCTNCNTALGYMKDDPKLIQQLLNYAEVHNEQA
jgi:hypothetical protein